MTESEAHAIGRALAEYLSRSEPREAPYRVLAARHRTLPILPEWTGFVGLKEDGRLLWIADDDEARSYALSAHDRLLALTRGSELFPELAFLRPQVGPDWETCWSCSGTGSVMFDGQQIEGVRCRCGGLGSLPPDVAALLRAKA